MHPDLDGLISSSAKYMRRKLEEDRTVPLFAACLDEHGKPLVLNIVLDEEYDAPQSTGGNVELLRYAIRETGTSGGIFCAPMVLHMSDGAEHPAARLHVDHIDDPCAYTITLPYRFNENGELEGGDRIIEETDDLIFPR